MNEDSYAKFQPIFEKIDGMMNDKKLIIAVDGGSGSGKTTLSRLLEEIYSCTVFHTDDFFLCPEQRTPERFSETGGNIDRERFEEEILIPLSRNETIAFRKFDCSTMSLLPAEQINPEKLIIIEGVYSMHPAFSDYYDFSVFLDISPELQKERISKRNTPQKAERFFSEWIPLENRYFAEMNVKQRCDISFEV